MASKSADDEKKWRKRLYDCVVPSVLLHRQLTLLEVEQAWFNDYDPVLLAEGLRKGGYRTLLEFAKEHPDDITVEMCTNMGYTGGVLKQGPRPPKLISDNMRLIRQSPGLRKPNIYDQQKGIRNPMVLARLRRRQMEEEERARRKTATVTRSASVAPSSSSRPSPYASQSSSGFRGAFSGGYRGGARGGAVRTLGSSSSFRVGHDDRTSSFHDSNRESSSSFRDSDRPLVRTGGYSVNVPAAPQSTYFERNSPSKILDSKALNGWDKREPSVSNGSREVLQNARFYQPEPPKRDFFDHFKEEEKPHRPTSGGDNNGWAPYPMERPRVVPHQSKLQEWADGDRYREDPPVIGMSHSEFLAQDELTRCKEVLNNKKHVLGAALLRPLPVELANNDEDGPDGAEWYTESDESDGPSFPVSTMNRNRYREAPSSRFKRPQTPERVEEPKPVVTVRRAFGSIRLDSSKVQESASSLVAAARVELPVVVKEAKLDGYQREDKATKALHSNGYPSGDLHSAARPTEEEPTENKRSYGSLWIARMRMYSERPTQ